MNEDYRAHIDSLTQEVARLRNEVARYKQTDNLSRASEQRYRAIFNQTSVGLAQLAPDGRFLDANRLLCNILGYSREELLQRTYFDLMHSEDQSADEIAWKHLLSGEVPSTAGEKRFVRKDGTVIWVGVNITVTSAESASRYLLATIEDVSERRALQESLRRIASDLTKTETISFSGTWKWNVDTNLITASAEVFQLFGLPPSRARVKLDSFLNMIHPADRPSVLDALNMAVTEQKPYQIEYRICIPDGSERLVIASGEIYSRDESGKPRVMIGLVQDVTLRRKAEQALKESEQSFRQLFDNAVDGIFIADQRDQYIDVNPAACRMLAYSRNALVGKAITDLFSDKNHASREGASESILQDIKQIQVAEWEMKRSDGSCVPVEISARTLQDGRWMGIARDISERKRAQKELERYAAEVLDLYDNAPCGYHSLDQNGIFVKINKTELDWLGYTSDELIGKKKVTELVTEKSRRLFSESFPRFLKAGRIRDLQFEFVRKDGSIMPVLLSATAIRDDDGKIIQSRTSLFDMTQLAEALRKLEQAATVFEHTKDAIVITNADGAIIAVNKAFSRITGYQPEEVMGKNPRLLKSERQGDDFYQALWGSLEQTGTWQGEIWDRRKSGEVFPAWETISTVKDDSGKITDYISVFSDITTIKATEEKLVKLAYHDALTSLPNRLLFADRLAQTLAHAKRNLVRSALLLLDLDRFKLINDTLGHAAGDQLLKIVGDRLKGVIRAEDTVARLGSDEFAVVLAQLDNTDDAALLARKLTQLVAQPIQIANQTLQMSTSIGVGIYPDDGEDPETLAKSADMAMYGAKEKGGNAYEFYTPEMTRTAIKALTIDRDLRFALDHNQLLLLYQPQISLSNGRIVGLEALIRWNSPVNGQQSPLTFIPVAEETDLIEAIGEWVLDTALAQLQRWRLSGVPPIRLGINLSVRQIKRAHFVSEVCRKLRASQPLDGFGLDLEVTETALQTESDTVAALKELKTLGLRIAIDDFGTGYSSLNSLKHLPVDVLKIDRSFIHGIPRDADDKAITSAIIAMGHTLGMNIIAEGVETAEQLEFIMDQHCDDVQGFLFFPPLSADVCEQFLKSGRTIDLDQSSQRLPSLPAHSS